MIKIKGRKTNYISFTLIFFLLTCTLKENETKCLPYHCTVTIAVNGQDFMLWGFYFRLPTTDANL